MAVETGVFTLNEASKKNMKKISTKTQIPFEIIKVVYEYSLFSCALDLINSNKKFREIVIPYFGKIGVKDSVEGALDEDYELFFSPSQNLRKLLADIKKNDYKALEQFLDSKIKKEVESIGDING